jgi:hypothetical protein
MSINNVKINKNMCKISYLSIYEELVVTTYLIFVLCRRLQIANYGLYRFRIADFGLRIVSIADFGLRNADCINCGLRIAECGMRIAEFFINSDL